MFRDQGLGSSDLLIISRIESSQEELVFGLLLSPFAAAGRKLVVVSKSHRIPLNPKLQALDKDLKPA